MTLNGAIMQLFEMRENSMMPEVFKPYFDKVIETVSECEEPRKGEWQTHYDGLTGNMEVRCSFCHAKSSIDAELLMDDRTRVELFRYCPNCGARMQKDGGTQ